MIGTAGQYHGFSGADGDPLGNTSPDPAGTRPRPVFLPLWWLGNVMCWIGGASWRDVGDRHERALYQMSGYFVVLVGIIAWGVASLAAVGVFEMPLTDALPYTVAWGLFVAGFDRTISAKVHDSSENWAKRSSGYFVRGLFAVLIGLAIAETASLAVFADPIRRTMEDNVQRTIGDSRQIIYGEDGKPSNRSAKVAELEQRRKDLLTAVDTAQADLERKKHIAECERRPAGCPRELIDNGTVSGVAGEGEKTRIRDQEAQAAVSVLAQATTRRDAEVPGLNDQITALNAELNKAAADAEALAQKERGFDARWRAMHQYTMSSLSALSIRGVLALLLVFIDLIPLLLKLLRGETAHDHRIVTRRQRTVTALDMHSALHHNQLGALAEQRRVRHDADLKRAKIVADTDVRLEEQRQQIRFEVEAEAMRANGSRGEEQNSSQHRVGSEPVDQESEDRSEFEAEIPRWWTPEDRKLIGKVFGGRFLAKAALAGADVGSFGRVLVGVDYQDGSRVVIKAVPEPVEPARRLSRRNPHRRMWELEVESAAKLRHPNIGELIGSGIEHRYMWTVSPLYEPGSLVRWIQSKEHRGHPLKLNDVLKIMDHLVGALVYAHARNFSHGDIKPSNLVLDGIQLMLVDWGLARAAGQARHTAHPTRPLGTRYYTAPEVFSAFDGDYSTELADIYSVGATWYFLLVGDPPYQQHRAGETHCVPLEALLPDLPVEVVDLVHRLISQVPRDRMLNWSGAQPSIELQREIRQLMRTLDQRGMLDLAVGHTAVEEHYQRYRSRPMGDQPGAHGSPQGNNGHDLGGGADPRRNGHVHGPREATLREQDVEDVEVVESTASRIPDGGGPARHQPTAPDPADVEPDIPLQEPRQWRNGSSDAVPLAPGRSNGHPTPPLADPTALTRANGGTPTEAEPQDLTQP